jgi:hypothetical protein
MEQIKNIIMRIVATFAASGLGVVGAGTIAGVPLWKAVFMAGIAGVATVVEGLSRAFLDDGKLSVAEINQVFNEESGARFFRVIVHEVFITRYQSFVNLFFMLFKNIGL